MQKSIVFFYTSNEQSKMKLENNSIYNNFMKIKYLGIYFAKNVRHAEDKIKLQHSSTAYLYYKYFTRTLVQAYTSTAYSTQCWKQVNKWKHFNIAIVSELIYKLSAVSIKIQRIFCRDWEANSQIQTLQGTQKSQNNLHKEQSSKIHTFWIPSFLQSYSHQYCVVPKSG